VPELDTTICQCLSSVAIEFRGDVRVAAFDRVTDVTLRHAVAHGFAPRVYESGEPPRLREILHDAVRDCKTEYLWTIEHDCIVHPGTRRATHAHMRAHKDAAGIDCMTVDRKGQPNYPNGRKPLTDIPGEKYLKACKCNLSLNCVCWRAEALRAIEWEHVAQFPACDQTISNAIRRDGWQLCIATDVQCTHLFTGARRWLPPERRYSKKYSHGIKPELRGQP